MKKSKLARLLPNSIFLAAIEFGEIIAKFDIKKSKLARLLPNSIFLAAIKFGEIIAKFDISGRMRPTCIFEFTSWHKHLISNMAHQTRVSQSRLAIGSPTPLRLHPWDSTHFFILLDARMGGVGLSLVHLVERVEVI